MSRTNQRPSSPHGWRVWPVCFLAFTALACDGNRALGQVPVHLAYQSNQPPGAIGAMQVARGVAPVGYVQPVQLIAPDGAAVAIAGDSNGFAGELSSLRVGLLVGMPYRLQVSNIPRYETETIYPSVELIGRLHPPAGEKNRFAIPIEISQEDLELAIKGTMVVRVVYLENPQRADPAREDSHQRYLDVLPTEDPLQVADELGRPMAILRLGSRVPLNSQYDGEFLFGAPPVEWLPHEAPIVSARDRAITVPRRDLHANDDTVADRLPSPPEELNIAPPPVTDATSQDLDLDLDRSSPQPQTPFLDDSLPESSIE